MHAITIQVRKTASKRKRKNRLKSEPLSSHPLRIIRNLLLHELFQLCRMFNIHGSLGVVQSAVVVDQLSVVDERFQIGILVGVEFVFHGAEV